MNKTSIYGSIGSTVVFFAQRNTHLPHFQRPVAVASTKTRLAQHSTAHVGSLELWHPRQIRRARGRQCYGGAYRYRFIRPVTYTR